MRKSDAEGVSEAAARQLAVALKTEYAQHTERKTQMLKESNLSRYSVGIIL